MASQNSQGIQALMSAEKGAAETIQAARKKRLQRLKEAKDEAEAEIEAFHQLKEKEYKEYVQQNAGSTDKAVAKMRQDAEQELQGIKRQANKAEGAVVKRLVDVVSTCNPTLHRNFVKGVH
eukprot:Clim_evm15s77 gene=Clim_evmTU15s77